MGRKSATSCFTRPKVAGMQMTLEKYGATDKWGNFDTSPYSLPVRGGEEINCEL
jgi:hypothetical protein